MRGGNPSCLLLFLRLCHRTRIYASDFGLISSSQRGKKGGGGSFSAQSSVRECLSPFFPEHPFGRATWWWGSSNVPPPFFANNSALSPPFHALEMGVGKRRRRRSVGDQRGGVQKGEERPLSPPLAALFCVKNTSLTYGQCARGGGGTAAKSTGLSS